MGFDLGAMLADVSNLDTYRKQITYLRLDQIDSDPGNFYSLSGIDELAANIAMCGLQQPLLVRPKEDGRYVIVSGHRRRAALEQLAKDDPPKWDEVACIVERDSASPALQQLRLIYANANTRSMTSAELGEQAAQVEKLLYQLKEEGYEFPGRMRDHVAQAVNASKTKLARLKVIRENLAECWMPYYKDENIGESVAYELAHMPKDWQKLVLQEMHRQHYGSNWIYADLVKTIMKRLSDIDKLSCDKNKEPCSNKQQKFIKAVQIERYYDCYCGSCCKDCPKLSSCKYACPLLADKIKALKADAKAQKTQEKIAQEEKDRPTVEYIQGVYSRIGQARKAANVSVEDLYKAQKVLYANSDVEKQENMESGAAKISTNTTLPFGYSFSQIDAKRLCAVADLLQVSIDYLLGRTDNPKGFASGEAAGETPAESLWHTGEPPQPGDYVVIVRYIEGDVVVTDATWGGKWWLTFAAEDEVLLWATMPEVP